MSNAGDVNQLQGRWVYRSLRNNKDPDTSFDDLAFGLGIIEFRKIEGGRISDSSLDMGNNFILTIEGEVSEGGGGPISLKWRGEGVPDSPTQGWIYDYQAYVAPTWDEATDKTVILTGSVLRTVAHGQAPAGVTGTFYMVKLD